MEERYPDTCYIFHTTTTEHMRQIKAVGKLIPTDHIYYGKLYPKRLHITTEKRAHIRMVTALGDEYDEYYDENNLQTFIIAHPCNVPDDLIDEADIEYDGLKPDNNAGFDGYNFYIQRSIPIINIVEILPYKKFKHSDY